MDLEIGRVYEGKVTGITKFGAFVLLPGGKSGMVHISEVANTYVDDISKHLTEGQTVNVKLIGIDQQGRINLSVKKALPQEQKTPASAVSLQPSEPQKSEDDSFESKLKAFMQSSESRMSDIKLHNDKRSGTRRRK